MNSELKIRVDSIDHFHIDNIEALYPKNATYRFFTRILREAREDLVEFKKKCVTLEKRCKYLERKAVSRTEDIRRLQLQLKEMNTLMNYVQKEEAKETRELRLSLKIKAKEKALKNEVEALKKIRDELIYKLSNATR